MTFASVPADITDNNDDGFFVRMSSTVHGVAVWLLLGPSLPSSGKALDLLCSSVTEVGGMMGEVHRVPALPVGHWRAPDHGVDVLAVKFDAWSALAEGYCTPGADAEAALVINATSRFGVRRIVPHSRSLAATAEERTLVPEDWGLVLRGFEYMGRCLWPSMLKLYHVRHREGRDEWVDPMVDLGPRLKVGKAKV